MNQENQAETNADSRIFEGRDFQQATQNASASMDADPAEIEFARVQRQPGDEGVRVRVVQVVAPDERDKLYRDQRDHMVQFARQLLEAIDMDVEVTESLRDFSLDLAIDGADADRLTVKNGNLLNEVQFLLSRYFKATYGETVLDLKCDANGFRQQQEDRIREIAQKACDQVLQSRESIVLAPMNSYERRLVHLMLKEKDGIRTLSLGDGNIKRVKIMFKEKREVPTKPVEPEIHDPGPVSDIFGQD